MPEHWFRDEIESCVTDGIADEWYRKEEIIDMIMQSIACYICLTGTEMVSCPKNKEDQIRCSKWKEL